MLIFSDVDGTLLADDGTCPLPVGELRRVMERHEVVLASSRDVDELRDVQELLGWHGGLIAEDGATLVHEGDIELLGAPRAVLLRRVRDTVGPGVADVLLAAEPAAARNRLASILVPIATATPMLREQLGSAGLRLTPGGRWATITAGSTKGTAARVLASRLGVTKWAAIGNAENDATLLCEAWRAYVIRNPEGHDPELAQIDGAVRLTVQGPEGWLEMLRMLEPRAGDTPGKERLDDDAVVDHHHPDDPGT